MFWKVFALCNFSDISRAFLFGDETNVPQLNLKQSKIGTEGTKTMSENDVFFWRGCFLMHCWDMRSGMSKTSWIQASAVLTQILMGILRFPSYIILTLLSCLQLKGSHNTKNGSPSLSFLIAELLHCHRMLKIPLSY